MIGRIIRKSNPGCLKSADIVYHQSCTGIGRRRLRIRVVADDAVDQSKIQVGAAAVQGTLFVSGR